MKGGFGDESVAHETKFIEPEPFSFTPPMVQDLSVSEKFSKDKGWQQHTARTRYLPFRWWNKQLSKAMDKYEADCAQVTKTTQAGAPSTAAQKPNTPALFGNLPPKYAFDFLEEYYGHLIELFFDVEAKVYDDWLQYMVNRPVEDAMSTDLVEFRKRLYEVLKFRDLPQPMEGETAKSFIASMRSVISLVDQWIASKEEGYVSNFVGAVGLTEDVENKEWHTMVSALGVEGMKRYYPALIYCLRGIEGKEGANRKMSELSLGDKTMLSLFWFRDFEVHQLNILAALRAGDATSASPKAQFTAPPECCVCPIM